MPTPHTIQTSRLLLRSWRAEDLRPFAAMNADARVMEHFPGKLSVAQSDGLGTRITNHFAEHGFGLWAVEIPGECPFAGFIGLSIPGFTAHFTPCVEVGWRLAQAVWGRGYATEGAQAVLAHGFDRLGLDQILSFTVPANLASRRVMEKIGMAHDPAENFEHPALPQGHRLRQHVLYRITRAAWQARPPQ